LTSKVQRTILRILTKSGFQISSDALDYLSNLEFPLEAVESVLNSVEKEDAPTVLSVEYIHSLIEKVPNTDLSVNETDTDSPHRPPTEHSPDETKPRAEPNWDYSIDKNPEYDEVGSEGLVDDFLQLFRDRYKSIRRIYSGRIDTQNHISPSVAKTMKSSAKAERARMREGLRAERRRHQVVLGVVKSKRKSKSQNVIVEIEDEDGSMSCVVPMNKNGLQGQLLSEKADSLLLDEVVCFSGTVASTGFLIVDDVIYPDVPTARAIHAAPREVYAAFVSDLHCGSQEFLEDAFDRLIDWIGGRGVSSEDKSKVRNLRYLFIAGDLVDGISVYPGQREHLRITSNIDQYAFLSEKIRKLPDRVKIFCIPGNHDACRQALPRPPVPEEFAEPLYRLGHVEMLGDPCQLTVEGVKILMTHGDSLDDMVTNLPGASYTTPAVPMIELIKKRHLAPIYGGKTELAPLRRDWMVIEDIPDVIHFGHAHHNAIDMYRGIKVINSGTFQGQTDFMRKQGVVPTPAIVTLVNLQTGSVSLRDFLEEHVVPIRRIKG